MPGSSTHSRIHLAGDGLGVSVGSSNQALLHWLGEFWRPWLLEASEADVRQPWLEVDTGAGALARALEGAVATGAHAACFTLDTDGEEWTIYRSPDGDEIAVDETGTTAISVSRGPTSPIRVLGRADAGPVRLAALRVVRELVIAQAQARNAISLHASAVAEADGSVTLFAGRKGAGKTTRLLFALSRPATSFISNDRVLLERDGAAYRIRGLPTIVSLRTPTLALFPDLGSEIHSHRWHFAATDADGDAFRREQRALSEHLGRPPGISPTQLCTIVGCPAVAGGMLGQVVFPRAEPGDEARRNGTPLDPVVAAARIMAEGLVAGGRTRTFLPGTAEQDPARLEAVVRDLAHAVPCFDSPSVAGVAA